MPVPRSVAHTFCSPKEEQVLPVLISAGESSCGSRATSRLSVPRVNGRAQTTGPDFFYLFQLTPEAPWCLIVSAKSC